MTPQVRRWLIGIIALFVALSVTCAFRAPMNDAPDEHAHYQYIEFLVHQRAFPLLEAHSTAGYEAHQPPAYYVLAAAVYVATGESKHAVRLLNTVLGVLLIITAFRLARELLPGLGDAFALSVAGFVGFLPMNLYILSVCSNDPLVNLLAAWVLLRLVRHSRDGFTFLPSAGTGALIGLAVVTKSTALPLIALGPLACVIAAKTRGDSRRQTFAAVGVMVAGIGAVCLPWFVRNILLYGDPLAMGAFNEIFTQELTDRARPEWFFTLGAADSAYWTRMVVPYTWRTFIGGFGHLTPDRFMPGWIYQAFYVPSILALIGLVLFVDVKRDIGDHLAEWQRKVLGILVIGIFLMTLGFLQFNVTYFQAQARYLFLMLPAIALLYLAGLGRVMPERSRGIVRAVFVGCFALLSVLAVALWVRPPM